jgi:Domain of unknown function (DUF4157)
MFKYLLVTAVVACIALSADSTRASGLSRIRAMHLDSTEGTLEIEPPDLAVIPEVIQNLPEDVREALLNATAPLLATAIRESRQQAIDRGVSPIPPQIRSTLQPYFPTAILDKARWTTAAGISLDGALTNWFNLEGAITLGEVIAFSDGMQAQQDVEVWAHELTHVIQYEQLGIEAFAFEYSSDFTDLEDQARDNASRTMASIAAAEN